MAFVTWSLSGHTSIFYLPNFVLDLTTDDKEAITRFFSPDLPKPETFDTEILIWKSECSEVPRAERLNATLLDTLQLADKDFYPNVHAILKLLLTLPVGSVSCERSFSKMRRLKHWSRTTMGENRLNGLALMFVHKDMKISRENVLQRFDSTRHRRIGQLHLPTAN